MIKKLMIVVASIWFAGAVGEEDFDNDLKNYVPIHQEGNKEPNLLELHKDKTLVGEFKKKTDESVRRYKEILNILKDLAINFKKSIKKIKDNKGKRFDGKNAINLDEYLSKMIQPIKEDKSNKKIALLAIFKDKPIKNYLDSIASAYYQYPLIFNELTTYLPFLKTKKEFSITDDLILESPNKLSYISTGCVKKMASLLVPESYINDKREPVSLKDRITKLQDLLFIIAYRQNEFNYNQNLEKVLNGLDDTVKAYLEWQTKNNTVIFSLKDSKLRELPRKLVEKSTVLKELINDLGIENCIEIPIQFSAENWDIHWDIIDYFSIKNIEKGTFFMGAESEEESQKKVEEAKNLLLKINKNNIKDILVLDTYLDIKPIQIPGYSTFFDSNKQLSFFSLMAKEVEKNNKYIKSFFYQSFIAPSLLNFEFKKIIQKNDLTIEMNNIFLQTIELETETSCPVFYLWINFSDAPNDRLIFAFKSNNLWKAALKPWRESMSVKRDIKKSLAQKGWYFSFDESNFLVENKIPFNKAISYKSNNIITCFSVHPLENIIALGTDKGIVELLLVDIKNKKSYCILQKDCSKDLEEGNLSDDQKAVKCIDWNDAGTECAVAGGKDGRFWYVIHKFEKEQMVEQANFWKKWIKPAAIGGTIGAGAWYIYNYLTKKPAQQAKEEDL